MRIVPLAEAGGYEQKEAIPAVKGSVVSIGKRFSGKTKQNRDYSFQDVVLRDRSGELRIVLKDRDPADQNWQGQIIYVASTQGKHGVVGIRVEVDDYKGKTEKVLWVTPAAQISLVDEINQTTQPQQPTTQQQSAPQQQPNGQQPSDPQSDYEKGVEAVDTARKGIGRMRNLYKICMRAANAVRDDYNADPANEGKPMTQEHFQAVVTTFFIAADRKNLHYNLPYGNLEKYWR